MPASEPGWWYTRDGGFPARLLGPLAYVWGWAAVRRLRRARGHSSTLPVICVGNFTAGGTGKTPLAIHIARHLAEKGERPAFLTRGYGGRLAGPRLVNPALDTAVDVGDEPLLLARHAPVFLARNRVAGATLAAGQAGNAPPTVLVMDDGLQNPGLIKDLAVAVVDGRRGLGNGKVIPAGPLRAPIVEQLALADAILVMREPAADTAGESVIAALRRDFTGPVLEASVAPDPERAAALSGKRVLALAGIANPTRFYDLLRRIGADVVATAEFPDHHAFSEADARRVLEQSRRIDALIATTEKDWVRLTGGCGALAALRDSALQLPISLRLGDRDASRLASLVDSALIERLKAPGPPNGAGAI